MEYYVDNSVTRSGDGSPEHPFKTIQAAAEIAVAGDMVFVAPGIYREYVNPKSSGTADHRITYQSVEAGKAIITGAEVAANWKRIDGNVWFMSVSNDIFDSYNPYTTLVKGDWFEEAYVALFTPGIQGRTKRKTLQNFLRISVSLTLHRKRWKLQCVRIVSFQKKKGLGISHYQDLPYVKLQHSGRLQQHIRME